MLVMVEKVRGADDSIKPGVKRAQREKPQDHIRKTLTQPTEWAIAESSDESLVGFNRVHLEEFNGLVAKGNLRVMQGLSHASRANLIIRDVMLAKSRSLNITS